MTVRFGLSKPLAQFLACLGWMLVANFAVAQAGVPVPEDSPVFNAFRQLDKQTAGYRMKMNMTVSDPRLAQAAASMGFGGMEKIIKGNSTQVTMNWKMPAMDLGGRSMDDWSAKAVFVNGHGARLISTPAAPRLLKLGDQMLAMQLAMAEKQSAMTIAQAIAQGPLGAITAGMAAGAAAANAAVAAHLSKEAHDFFKWKCLDNAPPEKADKTVNPLTDLKSLGNQDIDGAPAAGYEFYTRDNGKLQGPVRLFVAQDTGLPKRIEMKDPEGRGAVQMNYEYTGIPDIEVPECLANAK